MSGVARRVVPWAACWLLLALLPTRVSGETFTDVLGHRITWERPPSRIVSLSPSLTEILFAVGAGSAVVGVTRYCDHPAAARGLPKVGGIIDISIEAVVGLDPDLVLATRGNPVEVMERLRGLGLNVYALETRGSLERIAAVVRELGCVVGRGGTADSLGAALEARIRRVREQTRGIPDSLRPRVLFGSLEGPIWTAGPGSYIHELIEAAGGSNIAADLPVAWGSLSLEVVVARDPQVLLTWCAGDAGEVDLERCAEALLDQTASRRPWSLLSFARNRRVFVVEESRLQRPGPRVIDVLEEFAEYLHSLSGGQ